MQNYSTIKLANQIRLHVLKMVHSAKASHIGSCFSMIDILAVLYGKIMVINPTDPFAENRDRFILSKGHAAAAVYATLAELGFFPIEWINEYCKNGSRLPGHLTKFDIPGVEVSTGALGHGLPIGCGIAIACKGKINLNRVYVILGDGECDEGSVWETALFAAHHKLDNLVAIIDYNKIQCFGRVKDVLDLEPFAEKWHSFRWSVHTIDGHDHQKITDTLSSIPNNSQKPTVIIANTIKGKGVSFMENNLLWHYKSPDNEQYLKAVAELEISV